MSEEKKVPAAPAAPAAPSEPTELEKILDEGKGDAEAALEAEKKRIESAAAEPEKPEVKEPEKKETPKVEDDQITPEFRTKHGIPEKFKTIKAFVESYSQAEQRIIQEDAKRQSAEASNKKLEERIQKAEEALAKLHEGKIQAGEMTDEERQIRNEQLRYLQETDPVEYVKQLKDELRKEAQAERDAEIKKQTDAEREKTVKDQQAGWVAEEEALRKEYKDQGIDYDKDVRPAIAKIATERPYLRTVAEVMVFYRHEKSQQEAKIKAEEAARLAEKKEAGAADASAAVAGKQAGNDVLDKITSIDPNARDAEESLKKMAAGLRQ